MQSVRESAYGGANPEGDELDMAFKNLNMMLEKN